MYNPGEIMTAIAEEFEVIWSPLHGPRDRNGEFIVRAQHFYQAVSAGGADGPQRVGAALQLRNAQVIRRVALQPLQGVLT